MAPSKASTGSRFKAPERRRPGGATSSLPATARVAAPSRFGNQKKSTKWLTLRSILLALGFGKRPAKPVKPTPRQSPREWLWKEDGCYVSIVVTNLVSPIKKQRTVGSEQYGKMRQSHDTRVRTLIAQLGGCEVKSMGDAYLILFPNVAKSLKFAFQLQEDTGHPAFTVRTGVHVGFVEFAHGDVRGLSVSVAHQVQDAAKTDEIYLSEEAYREIEETKPAGLRHVTWSSELASTTDEPVIVWRPKLRNLWAAPA